LTLSQNHGFDLEAFLDREDLQIQVMGPSLRFSHNDDRLIHFSAHGELSSPITFAHSLEEIATLIDSTEGI
jgi:hypothetical protein